MSTKKAEKFATRLQELITEENISQTELANRVGVNRSMVTLWLNGQRKISPENLLALARVFGVQPAYIEGRSEDKSGPPGLVTPRAQKMIEGYAANANVSASDFLEYIVESFGEEAVKKIKAAAQPAASSAPDADQVAALKKAAEEFQDPHRPAP